MQRLRHLHRDAIRLNTKWLCPAKLLVSFLLKCRRLVAIRRRARGVSLGRRKRKNWHETQEWPPLQCSNTWRLASKAAVVRPRFGGRPRRIARRRSTASRWPLACLGDPRRQRKHT